jgi:hypothetical protein
VAGLLPHGDRSGDQVDIFAPAQGLDLDDAKPCLTGKAHRGVPDLTLGLCRGEEARVLREVPRLDLGPLALEQPHARYLGDHVALGRVVERLGQDRQDVVDPLLAHLRVE